MWIWPLRQARDSLGFSSELQTAAPTLNGFICASTSPGHPDAIQYTPILNNGRSWQIYNGLGFTGAGEIPKDVWFHLRLEVEGAHAKLYVEDMQKPALVIGDLKSGVQKGRVGLYVLAGETYF